MSDPDSYVEILDKWVQSEKNAIYDENIKGPNNSEDVLENYIQMLERFAVNLIKAIESEHIINLHDLNWPNELIDPVKDLGIRTMLTDRIELWCIRYPFVKSKLHINELEAENAGIN